MTTSRLRFGWYGGVLALGVLLIASPLRGVAAGFGGGQGGGGMGGGGMAGGGMGGGGMGGPGGGGTGGHGGFGGHGGSPGAHGGHFGHGHVDDGRFGHVDGFHHHHHVFVGGGFVGGGFGYDPYPTSRVFDGICNPGSPDYDPRACWDYYDG